MKVLVVDDSLVYQSKIKAALAGQPWLEIVGTAANGQLALDMLDKTAVDLITLDMEMPVLDGIETLRKLKTRKVRPKVIVFSSATQAGSEKTLEALSLGANDFVAKPILKDTSRTPEDMIREDLLPKIKQFVSKVSAQELGQQNWTSKHIETFLPSVVVIASSTGGPAAHDFIFRDLGGKLRIPILIAQHMPPVFTASLAKRISNYCGLPCAEAVEGEPLVNKIYVAPGNFHMVLTRTLGQVRLALNQAPSRNSVRPAADHLFESAAGLFGPKCMGFVLTGMGEDGRDGAKAIKQSGGGIMIQDQASCVVFGMPGAVYAAKSYDAIGSLIEIRKQLQRMVFV